MKRYELINLICDHIGAEDYLEIGIRYGDTLARVRAGRKVGVDPEPVIADAAEEHREALKGVWLGECDSDTFFEHNTDQFDVIFVDGLHLYEQVIKDILNGFNCLRPGGYIVAHDMLPEGEAAASRTHDTYRWNGDVWKAMLDIHNNYPEIKSFVVDDDFGLAVFWVDDPALRFSPKYRKGYLRLPFSVFEEERDDFMEVVAPDERLILQRLSQRSTGQASHAAV